VNDLSLLLSLNLTPLSLRHLHLLSQPSVLASHLLQSTARMLHALLQLLHCLHLPILFLLIHSFNVLGLREDLTHLGLLFTGTLELKLELLCEFQVLSLKKVLVLLEV
jgi:hypothetical protein